MAIHPPSGHSKSERRGWSEERGRDLRDRSLHTFMGVVSKGGGACSLGKCNLRLTHNAHCQLS